MNARSIGCGAFACLLLAFPALAQRPAPKVVVVERDIEYGKAGKLPLKLDVIRPEKDSDKPRPAIVWIHGGGWRGGNKDGGANRLAPLVRPGDYVGFSVGYRLTDVAIWPAQINDCKAAIRYIRANAGKYGVDPERIGVWGSSAGGHLVSMLGTSGDAAELEGENGTPGVSSRVTCVVDFCGPSDFAAFAEANPQMRSATSPVSLLLGGPAAEKPDAARQASPVTYVSKDDPPFLIMHGTKDTLVPISQAERLRDALEKAGAHATLVPVVGGGHGFGGPQVDARVKAFFDKQLLGRDVEVSAEPVEQGK